MEQTTLLSSEGLKLGTYIVISQNNTPPMTKHDVGEDIEFPGEFLEAELVGKTPLRDEGILTFLSSSTETKIRIKSCVPLPEGSEFFYLKVCAA